MKEKKDDRKYLLAVLSGKSVKVYLNEQEKLVPVLLDVPEHVAAYKNTVPEKVANFSDPDYRKEVLLDKFLHHIDNGIALLQQAYHLPLFVMGNDRVIGHFKKISHNLNHIIEFIHGDHEESSTTELMEIMQPYINAWNEILQKSLKKQIDGAMNRKKLVWGIDEVWKSAIQKKGRLLIVEKDFVYPAEYSSAGREMQSYEQKQNNPFFIKDAVGDIIEKVLEYGGDVEFVNEGSLDEYLKIAMIEYY